MVGLGGVRVTIFGRAVVQRRGIQHRFSQQLDQPLVLCLEPFQALITQDRQAPKRIERRVRNRMLAAPIRRLRRGLLLVQGSR